MHGMSLLANLNLMVWDTKALLMHGDMLIWVQHCIGLVLTIRNHGIGICKWRIFVIHPTPHLNQHCVPLKSLASHLCAHFELEFVFYCDLTHGLLI